MRILSLAIRRFRSIKGAQLSDCGGLNVLIGKNNAGKSNALAAIDVALLHLRRGRIASAWRSARRPIDTFTDRNGVAGFQIGIEFVLGEECNAQLREALVKETTQFERAIDQIRQHKTIAFIVSGAVREGQTYLFLEEVAVGRLDSSRDNLTTVGIRLLEVPADAGRELFLNEREATQYRSDLASLDRIDSDSGMLEYAIQQKNTSVISRATGEMTPTTQRKVDSSLKSATDLDQFLRSLEVIRGEIRAHITSIEQRETTTPIKAFAGDTKTPPAYASWLMQYFGETPLIHFRETKEPIGVEEANALLSLKVRRGGEERFSAVKQTVRELLGVNVDAFEPDDPIHERRVTSVRQARRPAEMDVNDFIVEANGAGIREALRIVLDLELKMPRLVLIEEPEVHLHPGLEQALHTYLLDKSTSVQMFLTTHSTNFVDAASLQNVYLVSRDASRHTVIETVVPEEGAFRIPSELGLRLSTVFMYDRLVFVEGRSDEDVLRELARQLGLDLTKANVGFVQMGGVRNFAHFAAEGTLDLLSRRRVQMWFIADRDETTDAEVTKMLERLGVRAHLRMLARRELENYLLFETVIADLIAEKMDAASIEASRPTPGEIKGTLKSVADGLKSEVVRLRVERQVLRPVFLQSRATKGSAADRIDAANRDLAERLSKLEDLHKSVEAEIEPKWATESTQLAPGSLLLDGVFKKYGVRFVKEVDSVKLARRIEPGQLASELREILQEITHIDED